MKKLTCLMVAFAAALFSSVHAKAETTECTEITSLPATITVQGVYCLKHNLVTAITSGQAIEIQTNNVTIDLNGWKLGGQAAGTGTNASGIYATGRKNIIIRNGSIRGFLVGISLDGTSSTSSGHIIEDILADGNRWYGMNIKGSNTTIRNNIVTNTGNSSLVSQAFGIEVENGTGISVYGNTVSGFAGATDTYGIIARIANRTSITDNRVFNLNSAFPIGIVAVNSNDVVFSRNIVNSTGTGGIGLGDFPPSLGTGIICTDNVVGEFGGNNIYNCDVNTGNTTF